MKTALTTLRNLGPAMEHYCREVGVDSAEALRKRGYLSTYLAIKARHPRHMNRMGLYALYGALTDQDCMRLPDAIKQALEKELTAALRRTPPSSIPYNALP
jgi:hypothetical protein